MFYIMVNLQCMMPSASEAGVRFRSGFLPGIVRLEVSQIGCMVMIVTYCMVLLESRLVWKLCVKGGNCEDIPHIS